MSIFKETGQQPRLTEGRTALDLFEDRLQFIRQFMEALNAEAPPQQLLFFTGEGGNGKSLLLRYLRERCCWLLPPSSWGELSSYDDETFGASVDRVPTATPVPQAYLDFAAVDSAASRARDPFHALFMLKRQLHRGGVVTPLFDLAALSYLQKTGLEVLHRIEALFPRDEVQLATEMIDAIMQLPLTRLAKTVFETVEKRQGKSATAARLRRRLSPSTVKEILGGDAEQELLPRLPAYFAADLNDHAADPTRRAGIALFFDSHEAFWGDDLSTMSRSLAGAYIDRDRWLRTLLGNLELSSGIVVAVAGRNEPNWDRVATKAIPRRYVRHCEIGGLDRGSSVRYLENVGIEDEETQEQVLEHTDVGDGHHPLFLGLCADLAAEGGLQHAERDESPSPVGGSFNARCQELVSRILHWVPAELEDGIKAVACLREFSRDEWAFLMGRLGHDAQQGDFPRLTAFSFIRPLSRSHSAREEPQTTYGVHDLLRRILHELHSSEVNLAHQAMSEYYEERTATDFGAFVERLYHESFLASEAAHAMWSDSLVREVDANRLSNCRALLQVREDMMVAESRDSQEELFHTARALVRLCELEAARGIGSRLEQGSIRRLRLEAEIAFAEGRFDEAEELAQSGLQLAATAPGDRQREALQYRLLEVALYRGRLAEGEIAVESALADIDREHPAHVQARWFNLAGEFALFRGKLRRARQRFEASETRSRAAASRDRDLRTLATTVLNLATIDVAEDDLVQALDRAAVGLEVYRDADDPRGVAHALHCRGKALLADDQLDAAAEALEEARTRATRTGDQLLAAKTGQVLADVRARQGRLEAADSLLQDTLRKFRAHDTPYDIAHGLLGLAVVREASDGPAGVIELREEARTLIAAGDFGLLRLLYPHVASVDPARLRRMLRAFAAGDAFGLSWEGQPPRAVQDVSITRLSPVPGLAPGAVSDDTSLLLLTAIHLARRGIDGRVESLMVDIVEQAEEMYGVGPSTRSAIERYQATGRIAPSAEPTNGALFRALPVGWATPPSARQRRRDVVTSLVSLTHEHPDAIGCGCVVASMASYALEGLDPSQLLAVAVHEAEDLVQDGRLAADCAATLAQAAAGTWALPVQGVSLDSTETLASVLQLLSADPTVQQALVDAVRVGGDTDTVAALSAAFAAASDTAEESLAGIPWLSSVQVGDVESTVHGLVRERWRGYG